MTGSPRERTTFENLSALSGAFGPRMPVSLQDDLDKFVNEGSRLRDRLVEVEIHIMALERLLGKGR
mgnify:CR=1 FL=1